MPLARRWRRDTKTRYKIEPQPILYIVLFAALCVARRMMVAWAEAEGKLGAVVAACDDARQVRNAARFEPLVFFVFCFFYIKTRGSARWVRLCASVCWRVFRVLPRCAGTTSFHDKFSTASQRCTFSLGKGCSRGTAVD